ncbi:MAG: hypothetical protein ACE5GD_04610 [Candidatus Geothermarchaeales archaeon]
MNIPPSTFSSLVGKPVRERYGRFKGTVVAVETTSTGEGKAIVYENGGFLVRSDVSSFSFDGSAVEIAPPIIFAAEKLQRDLSIFLVQQRAAVNLSKRGMASQGIFGEVQVELDLKYRSLMETADATVKRLGERLKRVEKRRDWIYRLFMDVEVAKGLGLLKEDDYESAHEKLEGELSKVINETVELKGYQTDISSLAKAVDEVREAKVEVEPRPR